MPNRIFYVYILASNSGTLYTGMTNNLERRVSEHKRSKIPGFTKKFKVNRLVHFEEFGFVEDAIAREKQIKSWRREKKVKLITETNPKWQDLAADWFNE